MLVSLLRKMTAWGVLGGIALKLAGMPLTFLTGVLLARYLEPEMFGKYSFQIALATTIAMPAYSALSNLLLRELPIFGTSPNKYLSVSLVNFAITGMVLSSFATMAIAALVILLRRPDGSIVQECMLIGALALGLGSTAIASASLRATGSVNSGLLPDMVLRPGVLLFVLYFFGERITTSNEALTVTALVYALLGLSSLYVARHKLANIESSSVSRGQINVWKAGFAGLFALSLVNVMNNYSAIVFLGIFSSAEQVAYYRVAEQGAYLASFAVSAINMTIGPVMSQNIASGRLDILREIALVTGALATTCAAVVMVAYIFYGDALLGLVYGPKYLAASKALAVLACSQFVTSLFCSSSLLLMMGGFEKDCVRAIVISMLSLMMLLVPLSTKFGATGAAISSMAAAVIFNGLVSRSAFQRYGFSGGVLGALMGGAKR